MRSLSAELRAAVAQVLINRFRFEGLTDEDFAFLNIVSTYAQSRESGGSIHTDAIAKAMAHADDERRRISVESGLTDTFKDLFPAKIVQERTRLGDIGPTGATGVSDAGIGGMPAPIGATGPDPRRGTWDGPRMPTIPSASEAEDTNQADLPLGTMDRGPDPQDVETLLTTKPPVAPAEPDLPPIDPSDPPPDYTRLETAATRRIDS